MHDHSSAASSRERPFFFWAAGGIAALIVAVYLAAFVAIFQHSGVTTDFGCTPSRDSMACTLSRSPRGATRTDDCIPAIEFSRSPATGHRPSVDAAHRRADRPLHPRRSARHRAASDRIDGGRDADARSMGVVGVLRDRRLWAAVGLFIGFARPDLSTARLACLCCVLVSLGQLRRLLYPLSTCSRTPARSRTASCFW